MKNSKAIQALPVRLVLAAFFIVPLLLIPLGGVPFQLTKYIVLALALTVAFAFLAVSWIKKGAIRFPDKWLLFAVLGLPLAYAIAGIFAPNTSIAFLGYGNEIDTVLTYLFLAVAFILGAVLFRKESRVRMLGGLLLLSFVAVAVFQFGKLLFSSYATSGFFSVATANLFGKWNDLGIFAGLIVLLAVAGITTGGIARSLRVIQAIGLLVGLFFTAIINFALVWWLLALFSGLVLLGSLILHLRGKVKIGGKMWASLLVFLTSVVFMFIGGALGTALGDALNVAHVEARPSWESSMTVLSDTFGSEGVLGAGPNHFSEVWNLYRPEVVNQTIFWNVDFNSGVGTVVTTAITTGILGILAWLAVLILLALRMFNALRPPFKDEMRMPLIGLSLAVGYLFFAVIFYVPGFYLLALAFLLAGALVALSSQGGKTSALSISFGENPRMGFVSLAATMLVLISLTAGVFAIGMRYATAYSLQRATIAFSENGDTLSATRGVERAIALGERDLEYRAGVDIGIELLRGIVNQPGEVTEDRQNQFQQVLAQTLAYGITATQKRPNNYLNWFQLGGVYEAVLPLQIEGAYESAKLAYENARARNPKNPSIYLAIARVELANENIQVAKNLLGESLRLKPDYTEAVFLLSQIEVAEGNIQGAIESVGAATLLNPTNPVLFFQLGFLEYASGNYTSAITSLEQSVALNQSYANARYFLGLAYYQVDRVEDAITAFEVVLETNPGNAEVEAILENLRAGEEPLEGIVTPPEEREELPIEE